MCWLNGFLWLTKFSICLPGTLWGRERLLHDLEGSSMKKVEKILSIPKRKEIYITVAYLYRTIWFSVLQVEKQASFITNLFKIADITMLFLCPQLVKHRELMVALSWFPACGVTFWYGGMPRAWPYSAWIHIETCFVIRWQLMIIPRLLQHEQLYMKLR